MKLVMVVASVLLLVGFPLMGENLLVSIPQQESQVVKTKALFVTTLKNGMRVIIKPTPLVKDQVFVHVAALGGYSGLPADQQAAARVVGEYAIRSGIGIYTSEELVIELFEQGLEFEVSIDIAQRRLSGEGRAENIGFLLEIIHDVFEGNEVSRPRFEAIKKELVEVASRQECSYQCRFDRVYDEVNSQHFFGLAPLLPQAVASVSYSQVNRTYLDAFRDPAEFVCVIVGDVSIDEVTSFLPLTLQKIPQGVGQSGWGVPELPTIPKGLTEGSANRINATEILTRLTFPLDLDVTDKTYPAILLAEEAVEADLARSLKAQTGSSHGVDVRVHFPLAPSVSSPWFTVQFRSTQRDFNPVKKLIKERLEAIQREGVDQQAIQQAYTAYSRRIREQKLEVDSWISSLSQYELLNWDIETLFNASPSVQSLQETIKNLILIDRETVITNQI